LAVEADVKKQAEEASELHSRILHGLEQYYRTDITFGLLAEMLHMPVRGLIEFMQRYKLPDKGGEGDRERGLTALTKIRLTTHNQQSDPGPKRQPALRPP
jgi:hypothetical protein